MNRKIATIIAGATMFVMAGMTVGEVSAKIYTGDAKIIGIGGTASGEPLCDEATATTPSYYSALQNIACRGMSWVYYKYVPDAPTYTPISFMPYGGGPAMSTQIECSEEGGFWHFGRNYVAWPYGSYGGAFATESGMYGRDPGGWMTYRTDVGSSGHTETYNYAALFYGGDMGRGRNRMIPYYTAFPSLVHEIYNYGTLMYRATEYGELKNDGVGDQSGTKVFEEFKLAWSKDNDGATYPYDNFLPSVTAFCAAGSPDSTLAAKSSTRAVSDSGSSGYASTGIVTENKVADTVKITTKINEPVEIVFSHNMYSDTQLENVRWSMSRTTSGGSGYTISPRMAGSVTGTVAKLEQREGDYYVGTGNTDGEFSYLLRETYNVVFSSEAKITFCETFNVAGTINVGDKTQNKTVRTMVCVEITAMKDNPTTATGNCASFLPLDYKMSGNVLSGSTRVLSLIRNADALNTGWRRETTIYAKPGDNISWINCYSPGVQPFYRELASTEHPTHVDGQNSSTKPKTMGAIYGTSSWKNDFKVTSTSDSPNGVFRAPTTVNTMNGVKEPVGISGGGSSPLVLNVSITNGISDIKSTSNTYKIKYRGAGAANNDAGSYFNEQIWTAGTPLSASISYYYHSWYKNCCCCSSYTCGRYGTSCCWQPCQCNCNRHTETFRGSYNYAPYGTFGRGPAQSASKVIIPYNYYNTASFNVSVPGDGRVYAGDVINIQSPTVTTHTQQNSAVDNFNYATQVDNARVQMVAYVSTSGSRSEDRSYAGSDICRDLNAKQCNIQTVSKTLNDRGYSTSNVNEVISEIDPVWNVFDANAGDYMCFVMMVYPSTSGGPTNTDPAGDHRWYVSPATCRMIYKKPSFQVLGGSVYANGTMSALVSKKNVSYTSYSRSARSSTYFGSWVEQGIVSLGTVTNIASGAAIGKSGAGQFGGYGANLGTDAYCTNWVPLSFANFTSVLGRSICGGGAAATGQAGIASETVNRAALVNYWGEGSSDYSGQNVMLIGGGAGDAIPSATGKDLKIIRSSGSLTISGGYLDKNVIRIVKAAGDVTISGSILYNDTMTAASQIPKAVIYAKNIKIACDVVRIDAILITDTGGKVDTCYNGGGVGSRARSQQLAINGAVITDKMDLGRTYGNAPGEYSGTPAEIINYDASMLMWGRAMSDAGESDTMTVTYQHELAPRY